MKLAFFAMLTAGACYSQTPATLKDFSESRYNEPRILSNKMDSCVARDYTVETAARVYVLRQSTCTPGIHPRLRAVIGQELSIVQDKRGRIGILTTKGKYSWFEVYKESAK